LSLNGLFTIDGNQYNKTDGDIYDEDGRNYIDFNSLPHEQQQYLLNA
jgi:hypothetical protein